MSPVSCEAHEGVALLREVRPTLLIHAAWFVEHGRFWTAPENQDWLEASDRLARAFVEGGGRRILGVGSCAEYAEAMAQLWEQAQ